MEYEVIGGCKKCGGALMVIDIMEYGASTWVKSNACMNCGGLDDKVIAVNKNKHIKHIDLYKGQMVKKRKKKIKRK